MPPREPYRDRVELLQGTLDMLILQALRAGPAHGYAISQSIRAGSGDVLQVETGSLYPALHRLERAGWIQSEWAVTENNQRAKYYQLTSDGREQLPREHDRWTLFSDAIARLMNPVGSEGQA